MTNEAEELAEIIYRFKYPYVNNFKSVSVQDIDSLAQHLVASGYINKKNIKLEDVTDDWLQEKYKLSIKKHSKGNYVEFDIRDVFSAYRDKIRKDNNLKEIGE